MREIGGLYLVTNQDLLSRNSGIGLKNGIAAAIAGGVNLIQMREPVLALKEFYEIASFGVKLAAENNVTFLINDRIDVMLAVDAPGVHLGWRSLPIKVTRKLIGDDKIIGVSTHSVHEALLAQDEGASYVLIGPVYPTPSKYGILDPIGLDVLEAAAAELSIPVIAIGGINPEFVPEVMKTGVKGVAIMSGIMEAEDVKTAAAKYAGNLAI